MSDLISRSELLKRFLVNKDGHRIPERDCDNLEVTISVKDVKTIIKEQPTAYDIDKVVDELEQHYDDDSVICGLGYNDAIKKAIEIVKQGGVSDDVCEWECKYINDKYSYLTSCGNIFIYETNSVYCPYCGKKIKVVE